LSRGLSWPRGTSLVKRIKLAAGHLACQED
jgi:hypothetical protein